MARRNTLIWVMICAGAAAICLALSWVGYIASDDALYFRGAEAVLHNPFAPGDTHWTTRFPVIWSFAAILLLLGKNFTAFAIMSLVWYLAIVVIVGAFAASIGGRKAGWIAALLCATTSAIVTNASIVNCDLPEAFFLLLGGYVLTTSTSPRAAFFAGMSWGAAILTRETAVLVLAGMIPLFLIGRPIQRQRLLIAGGGIALVLGVEMAFQFVMTGHPLRRYDIAFNHDPTMDRAINAEGNVLVNPLIDPLLVLLLNNEFGILFWVLPFALWFQRRRAMTNGAIIIGTLGLANFLLVSLLSHKLVLNPRYFTIASISAMILISLWLAQLNFRLRWAILLPVLGISMLMISLQNAHPHWDAEVLAQAAQRHPDQMIIADPQAVERAELELRFAHLANVRAGIPHAGQYYLGAKLHDVEAKIIETYPAPPRPLGRILMAVGLMHTLPQKFQAKLTTTADTIMLWQIVHQP